MNVIYSDQLIVARKVKQRSMFLCGPTPRDMITPSWRVEALKILRGLKYNGTVFVPEHKVRKSHMDYDTQVEWEDEGCQLALCIVFWVPRNLTTMPAFTTNVEFGRFARLPICLYGRPDDAPKNRYLDWFYKKYNTRPIYNNLTDLLKAAIL